MSVTRRDLLKYSAILGCSLAASPLVTPISFAETPGDMRLVTIILRGGLDGLDVVQPYGDPAWRALRPTLALDPDHGALDLDGFYALHPALAPLMPLWTSGALSFVHATSTPYRDKRSHFDGQDLLEAGTPDLANGVRDGWLNRMLQLSPGTHVDHAYAIGRGEMRLVKGSALVTNWAPDAEFNLTPQAMILMERVMAEDPTYHAAFQNAQRLAQGESARLGGKQGHIAIAEFAAQRLNEQARVAAFSLGGWDTHRNQERSVRPALNRLSDVILTLRSALRPDAWAKTVIIAMTEFGRTARENGTRGTDHGTAGVAVLAGGAVRGAKVHGPWPGLDHGELYDGRDLMPTTDVRASVAWVMNAMGIRKSDLEKTVFPGLDMGQNLGLLL